MKILVLTYTDGINISGSFTSILDTYMNLRRYVDVDLKIMFDLDPLSIMRYCKLQNFFGDPRLMSGLTQDLEFESDIVIASCELLANLSTNKVNAKIFCDQLILLDSLDIQRFHYDGFVPSVYNNITCNHCTLLANPANFNILNVDRTVEYYHKFSEERVKSLDLSKSAYLYKRTNKPHINVHEDIYFENIGKGIFERLIDGIPVAYDPVGLKVIDGLCQYLKLFHINGCHEHRPLRIKLNRIIQNLFFDGKDTILELL